MVALNRQFPSKAACSVIPPSDVLFVTEATPWGKLGYETAATAFPSIQPLYWSPGMPKPDLSNWHGKWIICFKADLIIPRTILDRAEEGAINFHPSPPRYRGLGGYWWALNNGDKDYGVTVHHMDEHIDHGQIIKTNSFPIWPGDTEQSLKHKAAIASLTLLNETLDAIVSGSPLVPCGAEWSRHLYTSQELALAKNGRPALHVLETIHDSLVGARAETLRTDHTVSQRAALG